MRVGFIGLGDQGTPMARRIAASGLPTTVWARRTEVAERMVEYGAEVTATPAELGARCDVVGICVFDAAGVEDVLFGTDGVLAGMAAGGVVTVHSTVSPQQIIAIADRAAGHGVTVLDAPVSGGAPAAESGELLVILAGPEPECERVRPVLETYAGRIVRLGAVGAAQTAKLINNALLAAQVGLVFDALRLGAAHGLDEALADVLSAGSARSFALEVATRAGSPTGLARGQFAAAVGKDVELLAGMAGPGAVPSPLLETARELLRQARPPTTTEQEEGATKP